MPDTLENNLTFKQVGERECEFCGVLRPVFCVMGLNRMVCECPGYVKDAERSIKAHEEFVRQAQADETRARTLEHHRTMWPGLGWGDAHRGSSVRKKIVGGRRAVINDSNQDAWTRAHHVAWGLIKTRAFLMCMIFGNPGTGKTALAAAIAHDCMTHLKNFAAIKVETSRITTMSLSDKEHSAKIRALQTCGLLVLDDFRMGKSDHSDEILWGIINERNEGELPIIFTSLGDVRQSVSRCKDEGRKQSIISRVLGGIRGDAGNRLIHLTNESWR